ncbi:hypothetical protein KIN20_028614 [Parelaphostrongylus tenuis]|uniref:Uncharacterized protein n=1 Tax=Parelaphostrongylus tenuis TaxID=148309 RepID=A0AAD5R1C4_PARTN|nr:hypothetical protein KIN20_028614 [Parelaphostrongylus tenuis]
MATSQGTRDNGGEMRPDVPPKTEQTCDGPVMAAGSQMLSLRQYEGEHESVSRDTQKDQSDTGVKAVALGGKPGPDLATTGPGGRRGDYGDSLISVRGLWTPLSEEKKTRAARVQTPRTECCST